VSRFFGGPLETRTPDPLIKSQREEITTAKPDQARDEANGQIGHAEVLLHPEEPSHSKTLRNPFKVA